MTSREELLPKLLDSIDGIKFRLQSFERSILFDKILGLDKEKSTEIIPFWRFRKNKLIVALRNAAQVGSKEGIDLIQCRRLAVTLEDWHIEKDSPVDLLFECRVELDRLVEVLVTPKSDPWILVELQDIKVDKVTVGRHVKKFDYIKKSEHDGVYAIRKSKLHLYLTPPMVREYVG